MCTCPEGYTGDPFLSCYIKPERKNLILDKVYNIFLTYNLCLL